MTSNYTTCWRDRAVHRTVNFLLWAFASEPYYRYVHCIFGMGMDEFERRFQEEFKRVCEERAKG